MELLLFFVAARIGGGGGGGGKGTVVRGDGRSGVCFYTSMYALQALWTAWHTNYPCASLSQVRRRLASPKRIYRHLQLSYAVRTSPPPQTTK